MCTRLGIHLQNGGPCDNSDLPGIHLDSYDSELCLPADKPRLQEAIWQWMQQYLCTKQDLESLLGNLSHTVLLSHRVRHQLFSLPSLDRALHHFICLNAGAKADQSASKSNRYLLGSICLHVDKHFSPRLHNFTGMYLLAKITHHMVIIYTPKNSS